ncbi:DUF6805 domain-containing protein [Paenibacillus rhizoplanae]
MEHSIEGENTSVATWDGYNIRKAENGGWFSYRMKVAPRTDNYLSVTYFSGNNGKKNSDLCRRGTDCERSAAYG